MDRHALADTQGGCQGQRDMPCVRHVAHRAWRCVRTAAALSTVADAALMKGLTCRRYIERGHADRPNFDYMLAARSRRPYR